MVFLSRKKPPPPSSSVSQISPTAKEIRQNRRGGEDDCDDSSGSWLNPYGPPCLPSDFHAFRCHLSNHTHTFNLRVIFVGQYFSTRVAKSKLIFNFVTGLFHISCRVLSSSSTTKRNETLVRNLLLVSPIQLDLQEMLLEKLPEYFDIVQGCSLEEDVARLIINHFRWLDFIVNPDVFTDKLMQVLSICPLHLKKEIIGSLPEIIADHSCKAVVDSLEKMLQEDSAVVVPVLDSFSNLKLDDQLQEQVRF